MTTQQTSGNRQHRYAVTSAKGKHESGDLSEVLDWQREMCGSFADVRDNERGVEVSLADVDLDADDAEAQVLALLDAE